jgi:peroxiredoxin
VSDEPPDDVLQRLDPDRAAQARGPVPETPAEPPQTFNPRRYQWLAGLFGLVLVIGFSISQFTSHGIGTAGIPAGRLLPPFAAPLAASTLIGDANLHPPCTEADHDPRALNTCLEVKHGPLVLGFFVTGSSACEKAVDAMQTIAPEFRAAGIQFAAVAVRSGPGPVRTLIRKHGWTIPVAYDRDGAVGQSDGVVVCPLLELVRPGGIVAQRLIGKHWAIPTDLAAAVRRLAAG